MPHNHSTFKGLVTLEDDQPITTSLKISEVFGKQHKNIIQKLESLDCSAEFNELNFKLVDFLDKKGESRKAYSMTKDGFMFLVMSFTGKQAAQIKESYINAFNEMQNQLVGSLDTFTVSGTDYMVLQERNSQLQHELLNLYRDKVSTIEVNQADHTHNKIQQVAQQYHNKKQRLQKTKDRVNAELEQIEQEFIEKTKAVILLNPNINKSKLLSALGRKKDDKTARNLLDLFDGEYWLGTKRGGVFAYNLVSKGGEA